MIMRLLERKQLEKDVFKALNEAIKKRKTPIYTISADDIDYDSVYEEKNMTERFITVKKKPLKQQENGAMN